MDCLSKKFQRSKSEKEIQFKLDGLLKNRPDYIQVRQNGQRIFSHKYYVDRPTRRNCEVFVGNLAKSCYEDELIPLLEQAGQLCQFRLMLDFMNKTRGFAFASYFTPEEADNAIYLLNGVPLRSGLKIIVSKSVDNCKLFVGNIPTDKSADELFEAIRYAVDGVMDVIMYPDDFEPNKNRGFAFVEFVTHKKASLARRQLTPHNLILWNRELYVNWSEPIPDVNSEIMATVKSLVGKILGNHKLVLHQQLDHFLDNELGHQTQHWTILHLHDTFINKSESLVRRPPLFDPVEPEAVCELVRANPGRE
ncbi:probable RNA-binding protein 46 [Diabrotica virgifera virgifera]|uniref:RRM domain-containing protein n=2 Tax=Diabrotica virgifera virgifera TaxID=50390 RepID=A0ABM5L0S7_DIAVI|nr:probable RNA-binding protein 46 [Diabrotica virgifera virgifera]